VDWVLLLGRILFAGIFIWSGVGFHLLGRDAAVGYSRAKNAPFPEITVPLTGVAIVAAGVMIVIGLWVDLAALVIVAFLLLTAFIMHAFWKVSEPQEKQMETIQFSKDLSLAGAGLVLFYLFQQFGEGIGIVLEPALFD
jgi:putative oxidoreductase